jgi:DNA polymerase
LSNIEGRDQAWLAGEEWKLQAFRDFDTIIGTDAKGEPIRLGHDLYKLAYSKSFGIRPEDVTKNQRQVGKVQELALGYEGGVGAFLTFSLAYNIDLEAMAVEAYGNIPDDALRAAGEFYDWTLKQKRSDFGLSRTAFVVCDSFKRLWRQAHPNIAALWKELEAACVDAVESPASTIPCRKFKVRRDGAWLRIGLPSGRALCYPQPRVDDGKLSYMGVNQYTRQWCRLKTYGGKLFENCCQAVARDVMAANMPRIESAGYPIVLTVHDEVLTEPQDLHAFNADHLSQLLAANPAWASDMPLAAAGFEAYRYRKD